jgi:hypothetical protein
MASAEKKGKTLPDSRRGVFGALGKAAPNQGIRMARVVRCIGIEMETTAALGNRAGPGRFHDILRPGARVLLADADGATRRRLAGRLCLAGYDVIAVANLAQALFRIGGVMLGRESLDAIVWGFAAPGRLGKNVSEALCRDGRRIPLFLYGRAAE